MGWATIFEFASGEADDQINADTINALPNQLRESQANFKSATQSMAHPTLALEFQCTQDEQWCSVVLSCFASRGDAASHPTSAVRITLREFAMRIHSASELASRPVGERTVSEPIAGLQDLRDQLFKCPEAAENERMVKASFVEVLYLICAAL